MEHESVNGRTSLEYRRTLTMTEANRGFVKITKVGRLLFPQRGVVFGLKLESPDGNESLQVKIDRQYRIWNDVIHARLGLSVGDVAIFRKIGDSVVLKKA